MQLTNSMCHVLRAVFADPPFHPKKQGTPLEKTHNRIYVVKGQDFQSLCVSFNAAKSWLKAQFEGQKRAKE